MAKTTKNWSTKDYAVQAEEFVACYGVGYCRDEFIDEYCRLFEGRLPFDPDKLLLAIIAAERSA